MIYGKKFRHLERNCGFSSDLLTKSKLLEKHFSQFRKVMSENEDISGSFEEYKTYQQKNTTKDSSDFEKHNITLKIALQPHLIDLSKASKAY